MFQIQTLKSSGSYLHFISTDSNASNVRFHICLITNRFMWICKQLLWWNSPFALEDPSIWVLDLFETHLTAGVTNAIIGWGRLWLTGRSANQAGCLQPIACPLTCSLPKWAAPSALHPRFKSEVDWSSGAQGICPVGRSVLGTFGALKMHKNDLNSLLGLYKCTKTP